MPKITDLTAASTLAGTEALPVVQSATTKQATVAGLTAGLNAFTGDSGSGGAKGLVPAPAAGDAAAGKVLKADGTWASAGGSLTSASNFAAADVSIVSGGTWADAASVSLTAGTWLIHGHTTVSIGSNSTVFVSVKLYNSTDSVDYASGQVTPAGGTTPHVAAVALSYIVTLAATKTIKLAGNSASSGIATLLYQAPNNGTPVNGATGITAVKIA